MTGLWQEVCFESPEPAQSVSSDEANAEQEQVIYCDAWPCGTHAGPGAGKSRTIVEKVSRLARARESSLGEEAQGSVLVLTFTNAGKDVLRRRLARANIPAGAVEVRGTQEACWKAYRACHPGQKLLTTGEQRTLLTKAISDVAIEVPTNLESIVRQVASRINEFAELSSALCEVVSPAVLDAYALQKASVKRYDNRDVHWWIVANAHRIVAGWVRKGIGVVLLDEAQDSSPAEVALLSAAHAAGLKVGYVGDLRQLLYGFRGAEPDLLIGALSAAGGFHIEVLRTNRRSKAIPVAELNRFSAWAFEGTEAEPMYALAPGGEPFRAVVCPEQSAVLEVLPQALAAVEGLVRTRSTSRLAPDSALARALGLPKRLNNGESLLLEVANRDDADELERVLNDWGYLSVMLVRRDDAPALLDLLHGLLDPEGHSAGPVTWYGLESPLCLALNTLRHRPGLEMDKKSPAAKKVDDVLRSLRQHRATRTFDEILDHGKRKVNELEGKRDPGLSSYCKQAVNLINEWTEIRRAERQGDISAHEVLRRLLALAPQIASRSVDQSRGHPLIAHLERACASRQEAARQITEWVERPSLGRVGEKLVPDANEPPVLYVAVVNQVKGEEADYAVIVSLGPGRFPYRGVDTRDERCRWWVAISRARCGTSYIGVDKECAYWPPRSDSQSR